MSVIRPEADGLGQVIERLMYAIQLCQGMSAMVICVEVVGILLDQRAIPFDQGLRTLGVMFDVPGQWTIIDLE